MGYIYLITNKINNKKYVGKTTKSIKERWEEHLKDSKKEKCEIRPLYRAIRKYGIENFTIEEIEKCNIISLSEKEQYWIKYYNTYEDGYNATLGGDGSILLDYDEIKPLFNDLHLVEEIYSYGFSYSDVDMVYIKKICQSVSTDSIVWYLHSYDNSKADIVKSKIRACGFDGKFDVFSKNYTNFYLFL